LNTSALKTFAPAVRRQLMEAVTRKLDYVLSAQTPDYLTTFAPQVAALRRLAQTDRAGLIERVAYTWFNRLAALRFMDARGWHPFRARVLTPASAAETQPELLKLVRGGAIPEELKSSTDPTRLNDLLDGRIPSPDAQGEVYRQLVLAACRFYHTLLPNLFEKLDDETELLLPDDLLTEHSVVHGFRTEITDDDCGDSQRANVEILGWLYQFYISEKKDAVMARKSAVPTEDIPAVTQLFTPHWIVRYLVENSLGRLWLLNRPNSKLREHMPYYIEGEAETDFLKITKPEEIRLVDPACGSGHMLAYAFDLLCLIYEEEGYAPSEIPALILRHNLHGLEICPRAAQLAELALVFKAREKSRRFFQPEHLVRPRIIELRDVRFAEGELRDYIHALGLGDLFNQPILRLLHQFEEAKNFGSLIQPCLDERAIADVRRAIETKDLGGQLFLRETHLKVLRVLEQAEALTQRYHVVVANPPYMGVKQMHRGIKEFAKEFYSTGRADLFAMFLELGFRLSKPAGFSAMVTMESWMFLTSYEDLRESILATKTILCFLHMPYSGKGGTSMGINFGTSAVVFLNKSAPLHEAHYSCVRYYETDENGVPVTFPVKNERLSHNSAESFRNIPGNPIGYWMPKSVRSVFQKSDLLEVVADVKQGLATADNDRFIRRWFEIDFQQIGFFCSDNQEAVASRKKWFPYTKGGDFRKWYGNNEYVVNWQNDGSEIRNFEDDKGNVRSAVRNPSYYFKGGITYGLISTFGFSARRVFGGSIFDVGGSMIFPNIPPDALLGFLCSKVATCIISILNPTLNFQVGDVGRLPILKTAFTSTSAFSHADLITLARADWDNFETSWDFRDQPLLRPGLKGATLEASWRNWEAQSTAAIRRMQELETENNRLFIAAYGLDGELQPEVPEAQITLARADARKDMAAFLSYAVGCMFGRYSLSAPGLILADAGDTLEDFWKKVASDQWPVAREKASSDAASQLTTDHWPLTPEFHPDPDGILPVLDGEWFEDDIVARTRDFLRVTFGEATLRENIRFIEDSLGKDLRKYFLTDFYKDHLQTYKKRPIYWLVQSPKKGFSVLLYLHRYTRDTMNLVLNRYLRDYEVKLRNRLTHLAEQEATAPSAKAKTEARKEGDKLKKILHECEEWERQTLLPLAQARIELDLDDGVKVNYLKLGEALAPIPGLAAKEAE
jgi:hypothetical protein